MPDRDSLDPRGEVELVFDEVDAPEGRSGPCLAFVEVEKNGQSVGLGEWDEREDGRHVLRFPDPYAEIPLDDLLFAVQAHLLDRAVCSDEQFDAAMWAEAMESHGETIAAVQRLRHILEERDEASEPGPREES